MTDSAGSRTYLVVMGHPDDPELTVDGAVARWIRAGARAILVLATDGSRGDKAGGVDRAMAARRADEQRAAAAFIGYEEVVFLGFADGELNEADLMPALVREIRRVRPDVAVFMDPLTVIYRDSYVNHRDHRVLGMAMLDALYPRASNAGYYSEQLDEGLQPWKVPETLLAQTDHPNFWVDVSDTLDLRFEALRLHASQIRLWPENGEGVIRQQRAAALIAGLEHGVLYAEEYRRIVVNPLA
ncbi:MAG TPA: PIG-L deacetylase family protein [Chloroflexota bacterium]|nr:PIG-L deacetylase family protein [Chloroflexota bacterium]